MMHMLSRSRKFAFTSAVVGTAVMVTACSGSHGPSGPAKTGGTALGAGSNLKAVCAAGQKEGELDYQSSTDVDVFQKEAKAFTARYPKIKIKFGSQEPQDNVAQIVAKVQAHHAVGIDGITLDIANLGPMTQQRLVAPVDWKALGAPSDWILTLGGSELMRTQRIALGLGYNTDKISAAELPDTWDELISPKWAGKFSVDPRGKYLAPLGITWGQEKAVAWYKKLLQIKPQIVKGATDSVQKVASGETLFTASSHDAEILEQKDSGAHVGIKYLDVVPTHDNYAVVLAGAKHPNAAACFLGWFDSPEGQAQQLKYEFKGNETSPSGAPAGAKIASALNEGDATVEGKTADQFASLTTG
jgi:iron(III) transport system substrate-binding protein